MLYLFRKGTSWNNYFASGKGAKYYDQHVCLSVRPFVYISRKPHVQISPNVFYVLPVVVARSSSDTLCTSGFVDDVMFSHNRANGPESKTTRMFRLVRQAAAPVGRQTALYSRVRQGGGTGGGRSLPFATAAC